MHRTEKLTLSHLAAPVFLLSTGSSLYYSLEILWRGFSHWSMAVCGGLCLLFIYYMNNYLSGVSFFLRVSLSALIITAVELTAGCLLNLLLQLDIWDYSSHTLHLLGQISPYASMRWLLLSIPVCWGCGWMEKHVFSPSGVV